MLSTKFLDSKIASVNSSIEILYQELSKNEPFTGVNADSSLSSDYQVSVPIKT